MSKPPLEIALALVRHPTDDLYLIALRKEDAHMGDFWEFPGGKRLPGEGLADCAARETREEVGLTVTVLEAWPAISFEYPDRAITLHPFLCQADSPDAWPLENRQVAWVAPADLSCYPFPPANAALLAHLQKQVIPASSPTAPAPV